ncbi:30S ribosomal protein S20 [Zhaonella formicivorans]|uniref:30S ribosomal protein S20 n=1 Tax=Zhaonella formicivorans TaxID=2528593 RepID=UPI0010D5241C|nr:30S ribosomal protein S20 [Zhaonella formicivorans]
MPNIKSAKKRVEITRQRTLRNAALKSNLKTAIKRFEEAAAGGDLDKAKDTLVRAIRTIDKAVTKGLIHKNKAARKKSRLQKLFNASAS